MLTLNQVVMGDTIRLCAEFRDWNGELSDPDNVELTIYDQNKNKIVTLNPDKEDTGIYFYDYTIELNDSVPITFEYKGILSGTPATRRKSFIPVWES